MSTVLKMLMSAWSPFTSSESIVQYVRILIQLFSGRKFLGFFSWIKIGKIQGYPEIPE